MEQIRLAEGIWVLPDPDGAELRFSEQDVEDVVDFLSLIPFGSNEWAGRPFELANWELDAIRAFYGVQVKDELGLWCRYRRFLYWELPKKNGKSEIAAALGLYHLLFDGEKRPNVGIFASDKANADIIYQAAKYMVEHSDLGQPAHDPLCWCRDSVREIRTKDGGVMKVYSSDAETKHGYSFSAIIIDELHAQPNRRLWDVLTVGSDAARRQQVVIVLTTAGNDPNRTSIGWEIHEKCRRLLALRRGEPERELDQDDPKWLPIMFGVSALTGDDPDKIAALDIYDEALWYKCNPGLGINIRLSEFRAHARSARQSEADERNFRWLRLNEWVATKDVAWLPLTIYDKTQWGPSTKAERELALEALAGKRCYGGLDLSTTTDLTALTLLFPPQEGLDTWVALFHAWRPQADVVEAEQRDHVPYQNWARAGFITLCPGDMVDFDTVEAAILEARDCYKLLTLGVDPYLSRTVTPRLMKKKVDVLEIPQTIKEMSPAMKELERLIRAHQMLHVHNTTARWCCGNVRCYVDCNENIRPVKNRSIGRIDIIVSWIIAMAVAMVKETKSDINEHILSEDWGI